jgi:hypothetical protein
VDIMLGLSQQIGGDNARIGAVVGDGKDLARPGQASIPTLPKTWRLASLTKALPGPTILSTTGTLSVPQAIAAIACAPPILKIRCAPARWQTAIIAG